MFCKYCGKPLKKGNFCSQCGKENILKKKSDDLSAIGNSKKKLIERKYIVETTHARSYQDGLKEGFENGKKEGRSIGAKEGYSRGIKEAEENRPWYVKKLRFVILMMSVLCVAGCIISAVVARKKGIEYGEKQEKQLAYTMENEYKEIQSSLGEENTGLQSENNELKQKNTELEQTNNNLQQTISKIQQDYIRLQQEIDRQKVKIEGLRQKLNDLSANNETKENESEEVLDAFENDNLSINVTPTPMVRIKEKEAKQL